MKTLKVVKSIVHNDYIDVDRRVSWVKVDAGNGFPAKWLVCKGDIYEISCDTNSVSDVKFIKQVDDNLKIMKIGNLKQSLLEGEIIELLNEDDVMLLYYRESLDGSMQYFIELNSKLLSMTKYFKTFEKRVLKLIKERGLYSTIVNEVYLSSFR